MKVNSFFSLIKILLEFIFTIILLFPTTKVSASILWLKNVLLKSNKTSDQSIFLYILCKLVQL